MRSTRFYWNTRTKRFSNRWNRLYVGRMGRWNKSFGKNLVSKLVIAQSTFKTDVKKNFLPTGRKLAVQGGPHTVKAYFLLGPHFNKPLPSEQNFEYAPFFIEPASKFVKFQFQGKRLLGYQIESNHLPRE